MFVVLKWDLRWARNRYNDSGVYVSRQLGWILETWWGGLRLLSFYYCVMDKFIKGQPRILR